MFCLRKIRFCSETSLCKLGIRILLGKFVRSETHIVVLICGHKDFLVGQV